MNRLADGVPVHNRPIDIREIAPDDITAVADMLESAGVSGDVVNREREPGELRLIAERAGELLAFVCWKPDGRLGHMVLNRRDDWQLVVKQLIDKALFRARAAGAGSCQVQLPTKVSHPFWGRVRWAGTLSPSSLARKEAMERSESAEPNAIASPTPPVTHAATARDEPAHAVAPQPEAAAAAFVEHATPDKSAETASHQTAATADTTTASATADTAMACTVPDTEPAADDTTSNETDPLAHPSASQPVETTTSAGTAPASRAA